MSYNSADQEWSQQQNRINWSNTSLDPACCLCWLKDNFNNCLSVPRKWDHYNYAFSPKIHSNNYKETKNLSFEWFASLKLNTTELPAACLCCPTVLQPYHKNQKLLQHCGLRTLGTKNVAHEPVMGGWQSVGLDQNRRCEWNKKQGTWVACYLQIGLSLLFHQCVCKNCVLRSFHISHGRTCVFWGSEHKHFQLYWNFVLISADAKGSVKIQKAPKAIAAVKPTASPTGSNWHLIDLFMLFLGPRSKTPSPLNILKCFFQTQNGNPTWTAR